MVNFAHLNCPNITFVVFGAVNQFHSYKYTELIIYSIFISSKNIFVVIWSKSGYYKIKAHTIMIRQMTIITPITAARANILIQTLIHLTIGIRVFVYYRARIKCLFVGACSFCSVTDDFQPFSILLNTSRICHTTLSSAGDTPTFSLWTLPCCKRKIPK